MPSLGFSSLTTAPVTVTTFLLAAFSTALALLLTAGYLSVIGDGLLAVLTRSRLSTAESITGPLLGSQSMYSTGALNRRTVARTLLLWRMTSKGLWAALCQ